MALRASFNGDEPSDRGRSLGPLGSRARIPGGRPATVLAELEHAHLGSDGAFLAAWVALGVAAGLNYGEYTGQGLLLVSAAVAVLGLAVGGYGRDESGAIGRPTAIGLAFGVAAFGSVFFPAGAFGHGGPLVLSRGLTVLVAISVSLALALRFNWDRILVWAGLAAMGVAGIAMIVSSPMPILDDWFMLQAATNGLSHGSNMYTVHWTTHHALLYSNGFVYLPGSAVFLWPFHLLFGDVRYGILAATVGTSLILMRLTRDSRARLLVLLLLLYPGALFGLEQSWVDPLVALGVAATIALIAAKRYPGAILSFAALLTVKQTAWILLPLAMFWKDFGMRRALKSAAIAIAFILPWFLEAPRPFIDGAIKYNLYLHTRLDSLSLYAFAARHGVHPSAPVVGILIIVVIGFAVWRLPHTTVGFSLGAAFSMSAFNLFDKLSFFNEWALAGELIVIAVVVKSGQDFGDVDRALPADTVLETQEPQQLPAPKTDPR